jgi:hypothetical protein
VCVWDRCLTNCNANARFFGGKWDRDDTKSGAGLSDVSGMTYDEVMLKKFLESFFEPRLKDQYGIFYEGVLVATLSEPDVPDQFWVSFKLTPETTDERLLEILFSDEAWMKDLVTKESESGRVVRFLTQIDVDFASRPREVLLRGPYRPE